MNGYPMIGPAQAIYCTQRSTRNIVVLVLEIFLVVDSIFLSIMTNDPVYTFLIVLVSLLAFYLLMSMINSRLLVSQDIITLRGRFRKETIIHIGAIEKAEVVSYPLRKIQNVQLHLDGDIVVIPYYAKGYENFIAWIRWEMQKKKQAAEQKPQ